MEFCIEDGILWDFKYDGVQGNIVIPDGVKVIGRQAFANCPSLFSVVIPDGVERIEEQAFLKCQFLHWVAMPDSVRYIGFEAFADCEVLQHVAIPESVTEINDAAFHCLHDSWEYFGEYREMNGPFCIWGKRGSEAERWAKKKGFSFAENREENGVLVIGSREYRKPTPTPNHDGNLSLLRMDDEYEWGIMAEGWPYERYESYGSPDDSDNYIKPIPWIDLYAKLDEAAKLFRWNGFTDWAAEYEKIRCMVMERQKTDPAHMASAVSVAVMREADRQTIAKGTPSRELMRRAAQGVFDAYDDWKDKFVTVFCGPGNNGGDGYALAEILKDHGAKVSIYRISDKFSEDGAYYYQRCMKKGIYDATENGVDFWYCDIYVDCLLGTGFRGVPDGAMAGLIHDINEGREIYGRYVISVDINSGMNGDTGESNLAVVSNLTVSIGSIKQGLLQPHARELIGKLVNADIGIEMS